MPTQPDTCSICYRAALDTDPERAMKACLACARRTGIVPLPPPRRPAVPCKQCRGTRFLHAIPREHTTVRTGEMNDQLSAPMFLTHPPAVLRNAKDQLVPTDVVIELGYGMLETYVCLGCGAVEWYCHDAASVPVHPHLMTAIVDYGGVDGPYR